MKKTLLPLSLLFAFVLILGAGCASTTEEAIEEKTGTENNAIEENVAELEEETGPVDCEKDSVCADDLVANCKIGWFVHNYKGMDNYVTVSGSTEEGCVVTVSNKLSDLGPLGDASFDTNNDGSLDVTCTLDDTVKTAEGVGSFIKENQMEGCTGEMIKLFDALSNM